MAIVDPDGIALQRLTIAHASVGHRSLVKTLRSRYGSAGQRRRFAEDAAGVVGLEQDRDGGPARRPSLPASSALRYVRNVLERC